VNLESGLWSDIVKGIEIMNGDMHERREEQDTNAAAFARSVLRSSRDVNARREQVPGLAMLMTVKS